MRKLLIILLLLIANLAFAVNDKDLHTKILLFSRPGQKEVIKTGDKISLVMGPNVKPEYSYFAYSAGKNENEFVIELKTNEQLLREIGNLRNSIDSLKSILKTESKSIPIQENTQLAKTEQTKISALNSSKDSVKSKKSLPFYEIVNPIDNFTIFNLNSFSDYLTSLRDNIASSKSKIENNNKIVSNNQSHIEELKNQIKLMNLTATNYALARPYLNEIDSLVAFNNVLINQNKGLEKNKTLLEKELENSELQYNYLRRIIYFLILTTLLIITIALILYWGYRQKKKFSLQLAIANDQLQNQNQQLTVLNKDKDNLLDLINSELVNAAEYVTSLIPKPIIHHKLKTDWLFIPSEDLGGDTFGYNWIDEDHFALYLLDVSGHGIGAALHSVQVLNVLQHRTLPNVDFKMPDEVLSALNTIFQMKDHNEMYFTLWYGVYCISNKTMRYASAGHPPAMLISSEKKISLLESQNLFIGAKKNFKFKYDEIEIQSLSNLYIFSDGVYEIQGKEKTMLSFTVFQDSIIDLIENKNQSLQTLYDKGIEFSATDTLSDDYTIIKFSIF